MLYELTDTALIVESFALNILRVTLIGEDYPDACIEESLFTESSQESIVVIYGMLEYLAVGLEHNACTCLICLADYFERFVIMSTLETLEMDCCDAGGLQIVAYEPETDFAVSKWTDKARHLGANEILAGSAACFSAGETVDVFGRTFTVAGVLDETGMGYDQSLFLSYEAADDITGSAEYGYIFGKKTGLVSMLLIQQDNGSDISALTDSVRGALEDSGLSVYAISDLAAGMKSSIRMMTATVRIMDIFAVVIASVSLFAMVTLTFHQRRKTAGSLNFQDQSLDEQWIKTFLRPVMLSFRNCERVLLGGGDFSEFPLLEPASSLV